jgi:TonB family protein
VEPLYPKSARELKLPEARCLGHITIDAKGKPTNVSVTGCATVFHAATARALMQWRFYPARIDGKKVPASFVVPIRYRP